MRARLAQLLVRPEVPAETTMDLETKTQRYRVTTKILGSGAFGKVYLGVRASDGELVAIKGITEKSAFRSNLREVAVIMYLRSKGVNNVTRLADPDVVLKEDKTQLWVFMEYIHGASLEVFIRAISGAVERKEMTTDTEKVFVSQSILTVMKRLAQVVADINQAGIIHQDLHPGNAMLRPDGSVVVIDFGMSCFCFGEEHVVDVSGMRISIAGCEDNGFDYSNLTECSSARASIEASRLGVIYQHFTLMEPSGTPALDKIIQDAVYQDRSPTTAQDVANSLKDVQLLQTLPITGMPAIEIVDRKRAHEEND